MNFQKYARLAFFFAALTLIEQNVYSAQESVLTIQNGAGKTEFTRSQLLKLQGFKSVTVNDDPAYPGQTMTYDAVPAASIFKSVKLTDESTILFKCTDGFSAPLTKSRLLSTGAGESKAYIAIENPQHPWPKLKDGRSIGPFYLIWADSKKSNIGTEEWPFMLSGFEIKPSIEATFPLTVPTGGSPSALQGYKAFLKNCFACHTLNGQGASQMGPDLNLPGSPVEYLTAGAFKTLIRDPQQLRKWPQSKMRGFSKSALSDAELESVIEYLKHMTTLRPKTK